MRFLTSRRIRLVCSRSFDCSLLSSSGRAPLLALGLVPLGFTEARHHLPSMLRHHIHNLGNGFCGESHTDPARNSAASSGQNVALGDTRACTEHPNPSFLVRLTVVDVTGEQ